MDYTMRGNLDILPMGIYVNDNLMVNIPSLKELIVSFCATMDTKEDYTMLCNYINDKVYRFKECGKGLYYIDIYNPQTIALTTESGDTDYYYLSNVNTNMDYFNRVEIEGEDRACEPQHLLGWPSDKQLIKYLSKNLIINCLVLLDDVRRAHTIYGPDNDILKGKMARKKPKYI